jgi:hypothetical protein
MPGGYRRRRRSGSRNAGQQEAQAKPSDWFGCAPHPEYFASPGRERCEASRELANNNPPVAARSFGPADADLKTRLPPPKLMDFQHSLFPGAIVRVYAGDLRDFHAK